jgi:hypothetical protein
VTISYVPSMNVSVEFTEGELASGADPLPPLTAGVAPLNPPVCCDAGALEVLLLEAGADPEVACVALVDGGCIPKPSNCRYCGSSPLMVT